MPPTITSAATKEDTTDNTIPVSANLPAPNKKSLSSALVDPVATRTIPLLITETTRKDILATFHAHYTLYESQFKCLTREGYYQRADSLRHPLIFYLGHTASFYVNKLVVSRLLNHSDRVNPSIESLTAVGVDEMSWDDLLSDDYKWPLVEEVYAFRDKVRIKVEQVIQKLPLVPGTVIDWQHPGWAILMGIEHERIHLETSTVLVRQLPLNHITTKNEENKIWYETCQQWEKDLQKAQSKDTHRKVEILKEPKQITLGRPHAHSGSKDELSQRTQPSVYGWDNEYGNESILVQPFSVSRDLITNADYKRFIDAQGYQTQRYWSEEGWRWVQHLKAEFPRFWRKRADNQYHLRLMLTETESMPWDWPVEVNALEAMAYCRWWSEKQGTLVRLPNEAEYRALVEDQGQDASFPYTRVPQKSNLALQYFCSSCPVDYFDRDNQAKVHDVTGNVWQWLHSTMYPFPGFKVHPLYDDFTAPTFDDQHNLIQGASWVSCGNEVQLFKRYAFRRHFYQHAGFRLCWPTTLSSNGKVPDFIPMNQKDMPLDEELKSPSVETRDASSNPYESDVQVQQYCEFHFGPQTAIPGVESFPIVLARLCEAVLNKFIKKDGQFNKARPFRALDIGCAVGRTCFELARVFEQVVGVDFSARFVQVGHALTKTGRVRWTVPAEGELLLYREAVLGGKQIPLQGKECNRLVTQLFGKDAVLPSTVPIKELSQRITFLQGDACNLANDPRAALAEPFHVILAANLIDRLYEPTAFVCHIHKKLVPGGFLVLLSPYTWQVSSTPRDHWLGARKVDGESVWTRDALTLLLEPHFDLVKVTSDYKDPVSSEESWWTEENSHSFTQPSRELESFHIPFVIRETLRKHQHTFSECTLWRKRA